MGTRGTLLALAVALGACDCDGREPALWVGERGAPLVLSFVSAAVPGAVAAAPPDLDTPVRALLVRRDGAIVALQEPEAGSPPVPVPPAVLLSRAGRRIAAFAGTDAGGSRLFSPGAPPWAAAEDLSGRVWVTGRPSPVVYAPSGILERLAEALPSASRGIAALPDGRMVVSYGVQDLAIFAADGTRIGTVTPVFGASYGGIDALRAEEGGMLLVATRRFGVTSAGIVLRAKLGAGLSLEQDPELSTTIGAAIPSALDVHGGRILVAPSLGPLAAGACARWLSHDLATDGGCAAGGAHRGAAWVE